MFDTKGEKKYTVEMTIPPSNYLSLPRQLVERHLTEDSHRAEYQVQAVGTHLQALFESDNDCILVRIPFEHWRTGPCRTRKLNDWSLYLDRWAETFESTGIVKSRNTEKRVLEVEVEVIECGFLEQKTDV